MRKRIFAMTLALCLVLLGLPFAVTAEETDELTLLFEENFDEYEAGVNVGSTTMPNFFTCDYNSIGDGVIHVQENTNGNLHLLSHVFTQIYTTTPIVGSYEFSLDILETQGNVQGGVFIRAPKIESAYYEADGYPDTSVCKSGLFLYTHMEGLGVNIKTYSASASSTSYIVNNTVTFDLTSLGSFSVDNPYNLRVTDNGEETAIYVNDTLICRVVLSDPGKTYENHQTSERCFGSATLYDAEGNEKGTYTDTLIGSDNAILGWTTRASNMRVDSVKIMGEKAYSVILAINSLPKKLTVADKETVAEVRALYDSLPEEKQALVSNLSVLTAAENTITELENATEAPTEEPTEAPTDPVTEAPTAEVTEPETTVADTEESTEAPTDTATEAETETEVKVIDDSLAIWILIAVMIVAVCGTAAYITVRVKKEE